MVVGPVLTGLVVGAFIGGLRTLAAGGRRGPAWTRRRWTSSLAMAYGAYAVIWMLALGSDVVRRFVIVIYEDGPLPFLISAVLMVISLIAWDTSSAPQTPRR